MTPDEARDLLDGAAPGEWQWDVTGNVAAVDGDGWEDVADYVSESNAALIAAAPGLAAMIAGMRGEWIGQYLDREGKWATICAYPTREEVARHLDYLSWDAYTHTRIVRRYVTEPEEIE